MYQSSQYPGAGYSQIAAPGGGVSNYHRLPPADHSPPPRAAQQSFTARYYDMQDGDAFPRPIAQYGQSRLPPQDASSFTSVALHSEAGSFVHAAPTMAAMVPPPPSEHGTPSESSRLIGGERAGKAARGRARGGRRSPFGGSFKERWTQWLLVIAAGCVTVSALVGLVLGILSLASSEGRTYCTLAADRHLLSCTSLMIANLFWMLLAMGVSILAVLAAAGGAKAMTRASNLTSLALAVLVLTTSTFAYGYIAQTEPSVVRVANLLCQEIDIWGCSKKPVAPLAPAGAVPASATPAPGAVAVPTAPPAVPVATLPPATVAPLQWPTTAPGAVDASAFEHPAELPRLLQGSAAPPRRLNPAEAAVKFASSMSHEKDAAGNSQACEVIEQICSGAPPGFDEETACVCSGQWDYEQATLPSTANGWSSGARRLQETAPKDPWQHTIGTFCGAWGADWGGEWCFVSSRQNCQPESKALFKTSRGADLTRSNGPCGGEVDSRSAFILHGLGQVLVAFRVSIVVGAQLLLITATGYLFYLFPPKPRDDPDNSAEEDGRPLAGVPAPTPDWVTLEQRFELAKKQAVKVLSDDTPAEYKLMLYGFFQQATEGDVRGLRPGPRDEEGRAKYDFWARHRGLSREEAIQGYIKTVSMLEES